MTLLIGSLMLNAILFIAFVKACNRADKAEYKAKMFKDDSNYWMNAYETANRKQTRKDSA